MVVSVCACLALVLRVESSSRSRCLHQTSRRGATRVSSIACMQKVMGVHDFKSIELVSLLARHHFLRGRTLAWELSALVWPSQSKSAVACGLARALTGTADVDTVNSNSRLVSLWLPAGCGRRSCSTIRSHSSAAPQRSPRPRWTWTPGGRPKSRAPVTAPHGCSSGAPQWRLQSCACVLSRTYSKWFYTLPSTPRRHPKRHDRNGVGPWTVLSAAALILV